MTMNGNIYVCIYVKFFKTILQIKKKKTTQNKICDFKRRLNRNLIESTNKRI